MAKKPTAQNFNLFEPAAQSEPSSSQTEKGSRSLAAAKIIDPCPRCGSRGAKSVRPHEHDGLTHYCSAGCLSDDKTDAFYFTPKVETFDEAAERERAKTLVANEREPREVETEVVGEGEQIALLDRGAKHDEHWKQMPEFVQENLMPWKTVYVHFESREDMERFAKLVKQKINLETQYIWYPEAEINKAETKRLVDRAQHDA